MNLNGHTIERVYKFKYLGVWLDSTMTFNKHFDSVNSKLSSCLGKLHSIKNVIYLKVNIILVKAYVLSAYDYCIDIWAVHSKLAFETMQNKVNRYLYSSIYPSLYRKLRRTYIKSNRNKRKLKYFRRNEVDMEDIFFICKLSPIIDRADWTRAKNVLSYLRSPVQELNQFYTFSNNTRCSRNLPLLEVDSCNSETFRKSVRFRTAKFWNTLPKTWELTDDNGKEISIKKFKNMVFEFQMSNRKSDWLKFT
jgi:hypothetical protein